MISAQTVDLDSTLYGGDSAGCWAIFVQLKGKLTGEAEFAR
jgi:hypothetical protein